MPWCVHVSVAQAHLALSMQVFSFITTLALLIHMNLRPYTDKLLNYVEASSIVFHLFLSSLLTNYNPPYSNSVQVCVCVLCLHPTHCVADRRLLFDHYSFDYFRLPVRAQQGQLVAVTCCVHCCLSQIKAALQKRKQTTTTASGSGPHPHEMEEMGSKTDLTHGQEAAASEEHGLSVGASASEVELGSPSHAAPQSLIRVLPQEARDD